MEYTTLGRTGVSVSRLCLGTAMFGYTNTAHEDAVRVIHAALDGGVNFVDTADQYSDGEAEVIVGKALAGQRRDNVVLATKFHHQLGPDRNQRGNSRRWIMRAVEDSLRRLQTDWIDLYQVHHPDPSTDIEETLGALSDLVRAGKVRYLGTSNFAVPELVEAQWAAERRGSERFVTEQPPYSILVRAAEAEVLPVCERHRIAAITWSPLGGGWLTGRYRVGGAAPSGFRVDTSPHRYDPVHPQNAAKLAATEALAQLAEESGMALVELALGFVLNHPGVCAAIFGPRTMEQLAGQIGATEVSLDAALLDRIDEIVPPGITLNPADHPVLSPAIADAALRRR